MYKPDLNEQQTRVLLEGLSCMELHLQALIKKTTDRDDRIDISNDPPLRRKPAQADGDGCFEGLWSWSSGPALSEE
ncbi:MAG: hypothetical protein IPP19_09990 [Verrucomicrobia bacterium]|nr:hypothetical protein [Verrucomicrobiota bacterium]